MVSDLASILTSVDHFWRSWEGRERKSRTIGQVSMERDSMGLKIIMVFCRLFLSSYWDMDGISFVELSLGTDGGYGL